MARKSTSQSVVDVATVEETAVATDIATEENMDVKEKNVKNTKNMVDVKSLMDSDEIEVVSLIPNISYKDPYTGNEYKWEEADHIEFMTFDTLRNMWRNHKGYFRNMWLKPLDERVISKLSIGNIYEKHEFLMEESNYTKKNIDRICDSIADTPSGMRYAIYNKIKDMIVNGKINDITVIRTLERRFGLDLISFID